MRTFTDKAKLVVQSRKFPQDQKGLEGFVLVTANELYDLYSELYEMGVLAAEPWKPLNRKTSIELVGV